MNIISPARNSATSVSVSVVSSSGVQSVILGSKYLKAAQALLDEVVNVGKSNNKNDDVHVTKDKMRKMKKESTPPIGQPPATADLTTAQRQDLQMKKAKLIGMLDEVYVYIFSLTKLFQNSHFFFSIFFSLHDLQMQVQNLCNFFFLS